VKIVRRVDARDPGSPTAWILLRHPQPGRTQKAGRLVQPTVLPFLLAGPPSGSSRSTVLRCHKQCGGIVDQERYICLKYLTREVHSTLRCSWQMHVTEWQAMTYHPGEAETPRIHDRGQGGVCRMSFILCSMFQDTHLTVIVDFQPRLSRNLSLLVRQHRFRFPAFLHMAPLAH
jgi:hypothetical protein